MIQIAGKRVLRAPDQNRKGAGFIRGDFYKKPMVGKPFRMWASNGEQIRMVETSKVVRITDRNPMNMRFQVEDGAVFELGDIREGGSAIMVGLEV
jgi:hypothetical protein